jgi:hypothetical protein
LEDICEDREDEKVRRTCGQGRSEDVAGKEASRNTKLEGKANGARTRCADILKIVRGLLCRLMMSLCDYVTLNKETIGI